MTISEFDHFPTEQKRESLFKCCGSHQWVNKMMTVFPVEDLVELLEGAEEKWYECTEVDWLEAYKQHPRIGDNTSVNEKLITTAQWARDEQSKVKNTSKELIQKLIIANKDYEDKFGYIFIVCATGKSAEEMLKILKSRLNNSKEEETKIAAAEQLSITKLRIEKLFS